MMKSWIRAWVTDCVRTWWRTTLENVVKIQYVVYWKKTYSRGHSRVMLVRRSDVSIAFRKHRVAGSCIGEFVRALTGPTGGVPSVTIKEARSFRLPARWLGPPAVRYVSHANHWSLSAISPSATGTLQETHSNRWWRSLTPPPPPPPLLPIAVLRTRKMHNGRTTTTTRIYFRLFIGRNFWLLNSACVRYKSADKRPQRTTERERVVCVRSCELERKPRVLTDVRDYTRQTARPFTQYTIVNAGCLYAVSRGLGSIIVFGAH